MLTLVAVAMAGLFIRAIATGEWAGALFLVGFAALFAWQIGGFVRRNRPRAYTFDDLPEALLPYDRRSASSAMKCDSRCRCAASSQHCSRQQAARSIIPAAFRADRRDQCDASDRRRQAADCCSCSARDDAVRAARLMPPALAEGYRLLDRRAAASRAGLAALGMPHHRLRRSLAHPGRAIRMSIVPRILKIHQRVAGKHGCRARTRIGSMICLDKGHGPGMRDRDEIAPALAGWSRRC